MENNVGSKEEHDYLVNLIHKYQGIPDENLDISIKDYYKVNN